MLKFKQSQLEIVNLKQYIHCKLSNNCFNTVRLTNFESLSSGDNILQISLTLI